MPTRAPQWRAGALLAVTLLFASGAVFVVWRAVAGTPSAQGDTPLAFNKRAAIVIDGGASRDNVDVAVEREVREAADFQALDPAMQDAFLQQALPLATYIFTRSFDEYMTLVKSQGGKFKPSIHLKPEHINNRRSLWEGMHWRRMDPNNVQFGRILRTARSKSLLPPSRKTSSYPIVSTTSSYDFGLDDDIMGWKKAAMANAGAPMVGLMIPVERTTSSGDAVVEYVSFYFLWDAKQSFWLPDMVTSISTDGKPRSVFF